MRSLESDITRGRKNIKQSADGSVLVQQKCQFQNGVTTSRGFEEAVPMKAVSIGKSEN
jgi:hypothetical protein